MPNYDYSCKTCQQTITIKRSITDEEKVPKCLKCNSFLVRQFTTPVVTFSSPGFYSTEGKI